MLKTRSIKGATLLELCDYVLAIAHSSLEPEAKYDLIFSDDVSVKINPHLKDRHGYYDPDTSYEEDVEAYAKAVHKLWAELTHAQELTGLSL